MSGPRKTPYHVGALVASAHPSITSVVTRGRNESAKSKFWSVKDIVVCTKGASGEEGGGSNGHRMQWYQLSRNPEPLFTLFYPSPPYKLTDPSNAVKTGGGGGNFVGNIDLGVVQRWQHFELCVLYVRALLRWSLFGVEWLNIRPHCPPTLSPVRGRVLRRAYETANRTAMSR